MKSMLTACILLYAVLSHAQETSDTFHIKDYKYRTPGFKALNFDFSFNGSLSRNGIQDSIESRENFLNLSPANFQFYKVSSTDRRLHESNYTFSISGIRSKAKSPTQDARLNRLNGYFSWLIKDQVFRRNNWFWEFGNYIRTAGEKQKSTSVNSEYRYSNIDIVEEPFIGLGKGRFENVTDAQMALFILNDLYEQGLITTRGTKEQQLEFSRVITDINNQRIFDNRRKRIYELQRMDSFIKQSGLSTATDIRHFTTINDNWVYSFVPFRKHGNQWYFRIKPGFEFRKEYGETKFTSSTSDRNLQFRSFYIEPEAGYESNKSISLTWQRNLGLALSYKHGFIHNEIKEKSSGTVVNSVINDYQTSWTEMNGFFTLGYFPNTRTIVTASLLARIIETEILFNGKDGIIFHSLLDCQTSYFLGYRTRLNAGIGLSYNTQDYQFSPDKKYQLYGFNLGFNCSITHNIF